MNANLKKVIWVMLGGIVVVTTISVFIQSRRSDEAREAIMETSMALWKQGFKTHFGDFEFKTDDPTAARANALTFLPESLIFGSNNANVDFLPEMSSNTIVIWKQDWLQGVDGLLDWSELHGVLDTNREALDAACRAALSGTIRFAPQVGGREEMWGDHLGGLRSLLRALSTRAMLELHEGNSDAAWTNLLAATRIVTAWEPEPTRSACFSHAGFAEMAFSETWQALQHEGWPDARLAVLQQEWESVNFFTNLPEIAAFQRVVAASACQQLALQPAFADFSISDFTKEVFQYPGEAWSEIQNSIDLMRYRGREQLADEKNFLLYYRDRELELRRAIQSPTWAEMRAQPGVTNVPLFQSPYQRAVDIANFDGGTEDDLPARMADAEARRRILITAIALERYRGKHGAYPATLAPLAPELLKAVPLDFMDGKPLRYRLTDDGHFVLYSVGLDCVDDGGQLAPLPGGGASAPPEDGEEYFMATNVDIVWPRPDSGPAQTIRR